ncbi:MAG: energy-coupling factor ABC transporter ATP-binding protein, partial [Lachnospiraceae bacterium]|nr:energy-coupling factor ABC transporter ATP-binding protein [Lachnospiraceae bacterium]
MGSIEALLEVRDLSFAYPNEEKRALNHISLSVNEGEFLVLCGKSGCGKSTLLSHLKSPLTPHGKRKGDVYFKGKPLSSMTNREQSQKIGFVLQNPENQIVTDKVWHELAFGLESLGYSNQEIRLRVAEMASYFGIQGWFYKNVAELSGGQKQLLNLASIMAMHPDLLILDEPTSQLDPIAASDFLETVRKINRDLGITVILTEHRLEDVFPAADQVVVIDKGEILAQGTPSYIGSVLK